MDSLKSSSFHHLKIIIIIALFATVLSCGGGSDGSDGNATVSVVLPPDPGEAGKLTLEGIDSDADGVRDDVQIYIEHTYVSKPKIKVLMSELAKIKQQGIIYHTDLQKSVALFKETNKLFPCLWEEFSSYEELTKAQANLKKRMFNTKDRLLVYIAINKLLGGRPFSTVTECK